MDELEAPLPLGASTPKKAKLDNHYDFLSESEEDDDSSLLFLSSGPGESGTSKDLTDSILFISATTDVSGDAASINTTLVAIEENQSQQAAVLEKVCCEQKCVQNFSFNEYTKATEHFKSKTNAEQRQFLLDSILLSQLQHQHKNLCCMESLYAGKHLHCYLILLKEGLIELSSLMGQK